MFKCEICGKDCLDHHYMKGDFYDICGDECFTKKFWKMIVLEKNKHIIINGQCFCVGGQSSRILDNNGFGGRRFKIKMNDGKIIETNNLWHQGNIPEEFLEELPDNATFVSGDENV